MSQYLSQFPSFRQQFPLLAKTVNGKALIYFDNAATTQKPQLTITSEQDYYQSFNANVHRASHALSAEATMAFEHSRASVKTFINAKYSEEIIWTKGATESLNLIAQSWGMSNLSQGDDILISVAEHHANIVPWQLVAEKVGANIIAVPLTATGVIDVIALQGLITAKTKLICVSHIANVIGKQNPVAQIIALAKQVGAVTVIDGAQAIAHQKVDVQALGCDFYVFSAHKMFGPTGLGVVYGRKALLEAMPPYQGGGEMIANVSFAKTSFAPLPFKFEAGTPNIAAVVAFASSIDFIEQHRDFINLQEAQLTDYGWQKLSELAERNQLAFVVDGKPDIPLFSFRLTEHHNQDIAIALDNMGIAVRNGHHCAMPLMQALNIDGCLRLSLAPYNSFEEIDTCIALLTKLLATDSQPEQQNEQTASLAPVLTDAVNSVSSGNSDNSDDEISRQFLAAKSWDAKHRVLMLLGKNFARMDKSLRSEHTLIQGCESSAWLSVEYVEGKYYFAADSDAKVIRGLLAIVLHLVNGKTPTQIQQVNFDHYFESLGLLRHLSPSRGNGLLAIVERVKMLAV